MPTAGSFGRFYGTDPHYPSGEARFGEEPPTIPVVGDVWGGYQPRPRYEPAYWERWRGLEAAPPRKDWFESMFGTMVRRFEAQLPTEKGYETREKAAERAEEIESMWAKRLEEQKGAMREEFWSYKPTQRGERPTIFQPRVKTVAF